MALRLYALRAEVNADYFISCDDQLIKRTKRENVDVMVMTPVGTKRGRFPFFKNGLCLPSGTSMSEEDWQRVIAIVRGCF